MADKLSRVKSTVYCAEIWSRATLRAAVDAGLDKGDRSMDFIVSPPTFSGLEGLSNHLSGRHLLWFNLHGLGGEPENLYGQGEDGDVVRALGTADLPTLDSGGLGGAIVFTESCYGGDRQVDLDSEDGSVSSFAEMLLFHGARAVVGGRGTNFGGRTKPIGADRLGMWFCRQLLKGETVDTALRRAKLYLLWDISRAGLDAKRFKVYGDGSAKLPRDSQDLEGLEIEE